MDPRLHDKLTRWHEQIVTVGKTERDFLLLEANEKPLYSKLFLDAHGKTIAEKEALVYSSSDWLSFSNGLAEAKAATNHEKRVLELKQAAYQAEYLGSKTEDTAISRIRGVT